MLNFGKWVKSAYEQACELELEQRGVHLSKLRFSLLIGEPYSRIHRVINDKDEVQSLHVAQRWAYAINRVWPEIKSPFAQNAKDEESEINARRPNRQTR